MPNCPPLEPQTKNNLDAHTDESEKASFPLMVTDSTKHRPKKKPSANTAYLEKNKSCYIHKVYGEASIFLYFAVPACFPAMEHSGNKSGNEAPLSYPLQIGYLVGIQFH